MYNKILLPLDLSDIEGSINVAQKAIAMAKLGNTEIHVLSIFPDFGSSLVSEFFTRDHQKQALHDIGVKVQDFVNEHMSEANVRPHVTHGSIYEEIINAAKKLGCDLIIMGSHRPELSDYLLGPNAARVVRHSSVSVLVVRG